MKQAEAAWRLRFSGQIELFYWALLVGLALIVAFWPGAPAGWDIVLFGAVYVVYNPVFHRRYFPIFLKTRPLQASLLDETMGILLVGMLIYLTGGFASPLFFLFTIPILAAALLHLSIDTRIPLLIALGEAILGVIMQFDPLIRALTAAHHLQVIFNLVSLLVVSIAMTAILGNLIQTRKQKEAAERLADELERANEQLKTLDQLKDEFIATATHELSTPLTVAKGRLSMALDEGFLKLTTNERRHLEPVQHSIERLGALIRDILTVSRLDAGSVRAVPVFTHLDTLVRRLIKDVAVPDHVSIVHLPPKGSIPAVSIDPQQVEDALQRVLENALIYTALHHKELGHSAHVTITYSTTPQAVAIHIQDEGPGIRATQRRAIFDKFTQLHRAHYEQQGSGLGLYIARALVRLNGGQISLSSNGTVGSRFTITFPRKGH